MEGIFITTASAEPASVAGPSDAQIIAAWHALKPANRGREIRAHEAADVRRALVAAMSSAPTAQAAPAHPDDAAVDAMAAAMTAKLAKQRAKGYGGWDTPECTQQRLSDMLREHVDKGDPVDVANFCAFLAARGEGIAQAAPAAESDAEDAARYQWLADYLIGDRTDIDDAILACVSEKELSEVIDADRKKGANHD